MRLKSAGKPLRKEWIATEYVRRRPGGSVIGGQGEMNVGKELGRHGTKHYSPRQRRIDQCHVVAMFSGGPLTDLSHLPIHLFCIRPIF